MYPNRDDFSTGSRKGLLLIDNIFYLFALRT